VYFVVDDVDELDRLHRSTGAQVAEELAARPCRLRDYTVRDASGHRLTVGERIRA
jgi:hypothetical protein